MDAITQFIKYQKDVNGFWCGVVQFEDGYNFSYASDAPMKTAKPHIARRIKFYVEDNDGRLIKEHGQLVPWPKKKRNPKN